MTTLSATAALWQLGPLYYDASQRQLGAALHQLYLEPRQHQLLLCLLQTHGQVVSRDTLIAQVWQGRIVSDSAINRAVSVLRKAFARLDAEHNYIETLPKLGYRLQLPPAATPAGTALANSRPPAARYRVFMLPALACMALLVLALLWPGSAERPDVITLHMPAVPVTSFTGAEFHISTDLAGSQLLYHRTVNNTRRQLWLLNIATQQQQAVSDETEDARYGKLSPDGRQIAYVRYSGQQCQLMLLQLPANATPLQDCPTDSVPQLVWQSDGQALYYRQRDNKTQPYHIFKLSLASGASRQLTLTPANYTGHGDIAFAVSDTTLQLAVLRYNTAHSRTVLLYPDNTQPPQQYQLDLAASQLYWHGRNLLLVADNTLYQFEPEQQRLQQLYHAPQAINSVALTAQHLYYSSSDSKADIWQQDADGQHSAVIESSRIDSLPRMAPDGSALVFLSNRGGHYQLWQQRQGQPAAMLAELPGEPAFARFSWSPDSSRLLLVKEDAAYTISVPGGAVTQILPADSQVAVADWDEHGSGLVYSTHRHGDWQLWHYDLNRQTEQRLAVTDGYSGRIWQGQLYFTRHHQDGLWRLDLASGDSELLLPALDKINWLNWQLEQGRIYYYQPGDGIYQYHILSAQQQQLLAQPGNFVHHYSVHAGQVYYVRLQPAQGDIYRIALHSAE